MRGYLQSLGSIGLLIDSLTVSGTGSTRPLGTNTEAIGREPLLSGMLVRTSGMVREVDTAGWQWFTFAEGYTKSRNEVTARVQVGIPAGDPSLIGKIAVGDFLKLTGATSQDSTRTKVILLKSFAQY